MVPVARQWAMKTLGLIVNPVAGMGGKVGLKGSDGREVLRMARELGATPEAPQRVGQALRAVAKMREPLQLMTYPHEMGEDVCRAAGLAPRVLGSIRTGETTYEDTERAARQLLEEQVDLLLFAGGDGTARNICQAVGNQLISLGIPAGVQDSFSRLRSDAQGCRGSGQDISRGSLEKSSRS